MADDLKAKYAIHEACREGQTQRAESLLHANPSLALLRDPDSRLPLHWAVSFSHLAIIELLITASGKRFDVDAADGAGWTALMMACSRPDASLEIIQLLLAKDADPNARNHGGQTALHFAASKANLDVARLLLAKGASARLRDRRDQLPLHRAAAVGSVPMIRLLLGEGKSPLNATDVDGQTALHHAVSEGHGDAAMALLAAGAEWDREDKEGKKALELAPDARTRTYILNAAEREGIDLE